jgi:hypothetical protein
MQGITHIMQVAAGFQPFFPGVRDISKLITSIGILIHGDQCFGHAL